jgi:hypothetical protein
MTLEKQLILQRLNTTEIEQLIGTNGNGRRENDCISLGKVGELSISRNGRNPGGSAQLEGDLTGQSS